MPRSLDVNDQFGTHTLRQLINTINTYITKWNQDSRPFTWTATANEIITRVRLIHRDFKKLLDNNDNSQ